MCVYVFRSTRSWLRGSKDCLIICIDTHAKGALTDSTVDAVRGRFDTSSVERGAMCEYDSIEVDGRDV